MKARREGLASAASRFCKRSAALLPHRWQQELRRLVYWHQIISGTFCSNEPEWKLASGWLAPGDWAIDVGANVGHYTKRFSDLVGPSGRVVAFEPVPATFELLAGNVMRFAWPNVTLLNVAASESTQVLGMDIPNFDTGLKNYYCARLSEHGGELQVVTCAIDSLALPGPVRVLKIDAEGHDAVVVHGARALLERDRPTVVIESVSTEVEDLLQSLGYRAEAVPGSPNLIYACADRH